MLRESLVCGIPSTSGVERMASLEDSTRRLQAVLDRLERAAVARAEAGDEALRARLDETRRENATLRDVNAAVSARLDAAIDRLKTVLEA